MLDAVIQYAERGWPVLPLHAVHEARCTCGSSTCTSPAKHPRTAHGLRDATTDPKTIQQWWKEWPKANVGILCGRVSGFFVLDVDCHGDVNGQEALAELQLKYGPLPKTLSAATGSGGIHYFFQYPAQGKVPTGTHLLGRGLDVRSDGAYVVAAPSIHATGQVYSWRNEAELAEAPDWLLKVLCQPAVEPKTDGPPDYNAMLRGVEKGERNDAATRLAGHYFAKGLRATEVLMLLRQWNAANQPPLSEDELATVVQSIARRELLKQGEIAQAGENRDDVLIVLTERFGVPFKDIIRVEGEKPFYLFEIGTNEVMLPAGEMYVQASWAKAITAAAECVPRSVGRQAKPPWKYYADLMMAAARRVEVGAEGTRQGKVDDWLRAYLGQHEPKENGHASSEKNPLIFNGRLYVRRQEFRLYVLNILEGQAGSETQFLQSLRLCGWEHAAVWYVPETGHSKTLRTMLVPETFEWRAHIKPKREYGRMDQEEAEA